MNDTVLSSLSAHPHSNDDISLNASVFDAIEWSPGIWFDIKDDNGNTFHKLNTSIR